MKIGLVVIATGDAYQEYARNLHWSAHVHFPQAEYILFSDLPTNPGVSKFFHIPPMGYPNETLYRYHTMWKQRDALAEYDYLFYCDADMEFVASPKPEIFDGDLTAVLHPGYVGGRGTPETRQASSAFCVDNRQYVAGGFQGGKSLWYLDAAKVMSRWIDDDARNNITAIWHDESHWNALLASYQFLNDKHDTKWKINILSPSYCYPEDYDGGYGWTKEQYPPILVCLDKQKRGNHPRHP